MTSPDPRPEKLRNFATFRPAIHLALALVLALIAHLSLSGERSAHTIDFGLLVAGLFGVVAGDFVFSYGKDIWICLKNRF